MYGSLKLTSLDKVVDALVDPRCVAFDTPSGRIDHNTEQNSIDV